MKSLREKLRQIASALEFANADNFREFERLLESRESVAPVRRSAAGRAVHRRRQSEGRTIDFSVFARRAALKPSGQC